MFRLFGRFKAYMAAFFLYFCLAFVLPFPFYVRAVVIDNAVSSGQEGSVINQLIAILLPAAVTLIMLVIVVRLSRKCFVNSNRLGIIVSCIAGLLFAPALYIYFLVSLIPTTPGRVSAARSEMYSLKSAIIYYHSDFQSETGLKSGRDFVAALLAGDSAPFGMSNATNVLFSAEVSGFNYLGLEKELYLRRWKGPYMDGNAKEAMTDPWGGQYRVGAADSGLYMHCAGADGTFENLEQVIAQYDNPEKSLDDIVMKVFRFREQY